jgi:hypothetical protein
MAGTVLLLHTLPDSSCHYDWMLEHAGGSGLLTYRVGSRVDDAAVARFAAERLSDHRREYLTFEGNVSGGRGEVRRLASGECFVEVVGAAGDVRIWVKWNGGRERLLVGVARKGAAGGPIERAWVDFREVVAGPPRPVVG